jgi:hypothetical protein
MSIARQRETLAKNVPFRLRLLMPVRVVIRLGYT